MNERHFLAVPARDDDDLAGTLHEQFFQEIGSPINVQYPVGRILRTVVESMDELYELVHIGPVLGENMDVVIDERMAFPQGQRGVKMAGVEDDQGVFFRQG